MSLDLVDELRRITAALDDAGLPYALCGGLALAVHGAPRATTDIDLLVAADHVERALRCAKNLGFRFRASPMHFPDGMEIRRITRIEGGESVTLDLILPGPERAHLLESRERIQLEGSVLWVVSREGLIAMKVAAGRPQDLADLARLAGDDR